MLSHRQVLQRSFERTYRVFTLVLAMWVATPEVGRSQTTPLNQLQLNLDKAVELALKQNIDVQIAVLDVALRQQEHSISRSTLLPHSELEASEAVSRFSPKAFIGINIPGFPKSIGPYQSINAGPSFSFPVFDLTLILRYQASGHSLKASQADEQTVREEAVLLTVSEYMAHLRALANITAAESRVQLATKLLRQASDLRDDGVASKIDVSRAEVRLREEQQRLIDANRDADTSLFALKRILAIPDSTGIVFLDSQDFFSTPPLDISDPIGTAIAKRPELDSLEETLKAAKSFHQSANAEVLPHLKFSGHWNEQGATLTTLTPGYEYRFDAKIPLFTGGQIRAERKSAAIIQARTDDKLLDARNRVVEQTRDSQVELQAALNDVALGKQEVDLAGEEVSLSEGRFNAGVTDNIEVIAAQDALARANDTQIGALFRYNIARAQLARATGSMETTYATKH
jgi:outer membrane protein